MKNKMNLNFDRLSELMQDINNNENRIYVGTDSHSFGNDWLFATVICCHTPGKGGRFYTKKMKFPKSTFKTLFERLIHEAHLSIETSQKIEEMCGRRPDIHIDVSPSNFASSKCHSSVSSYVIGMGYNVTSKPDSWASSCVADRQAR